MNGIKGLLQQRGYEDAPLFLPPQEPKAKPNNISVKEDRSDEV